MKKSPFDLRPVLATLALATLAGCGGGGGDPVDDGGGTVAPRVTITEANAPAVTAQAIAAGSAGFIGDSLGATGVQVDLQARPPALTAAWRVAAGLLRAVQPASSVVGVTFSETIPCSVSGSVRFSGDVASTDRFNIGDTLTLDFDACVEDGMRLDGELAISLTDVNADASRFAANATARGLQATVAGVTERADGSLRLRLDETDGLTSRIDIDATRLDFDRFVAGTLRASRTLVDYRYRGVVTLASGLNSETLSFVASGSFGALGTVSFQVATLQTIVTESGDDRPSAGTIRVTGANATSVTAVVLSDGVQLDVDTDGDGDVDEVVLRTWAELDAEL